MDLFIIGQYEQFHDVTDPRKEKELEKEKQEQRKHLTREELDELILKERLEEEENKQKRYPNLKVVMKGLEGMDENNLKNSKITLEFIAQNGEKVEKLVEQQSRDMWNSEQQERINALLNLYLPLLSFTVELFQQMFPTNMKEYKENLFNKMQENCNNTIDKKSVLDWLRIEELTHLPTVLETAKNLMDMLE